MIPLEGNNRDMAYRLAYDLASLLKQPHVPKVIPSLPMLPSSGSVLLITPVSALNV